MELNDFYNQLMAEVQQEYVSVLHDSSAETVFKEEIFTEKVLLSLYNEDMTVGEAECCHYSTKIRNANVRVSGYAISAENPDGMCMLDLFISNYIDEPDNIPYLQDNEVKKIATQCVRFLDACQNGTMYNRIDPSSETERILSKTIEEIYPQLVKIQIFVLTNAQVKTKSFKPVTIKGKSVNLEVVDITRLFRHVSSRHPQDEIVVDFESYCGSGIPCVYVTQPDCDYDCLLCSISGETLFRIYEKYGDRLLEANVRSFLSATGKVNKGIRETLKTEPLRFMAYNNGIVITVDKISTEKTEQGYVIKSVQGMQIVNGGQTVASMFFTKKGFPSTELEKVRVCAKVLILRSPQSSEDPLDDNFTEEFIRQVSFCSNSQNAVKTADLSSNMPFHIRMENLANTIYCPDGSTRWFYERGSGKYKTMVLRFGTTPVQRKKISSERPTSKKITKTDLAKYLFAWEQKPDIVSLGAQKNFVHFMTEIDKRQKNDDMPEMNNQFFKETIAKAIFYKGIHSVLRNQLPAFQSNVVTYLVSILVRKYGDRIQLNEIWKNQELSPQFKEQAKKWGKEVYQELLDSSNGKMISEWAKRKECWERMQNFQLSDFRGTIPEIQKK